LPARAVVLQILDRADAFVGVELDVRTAREPLIDVAARQRLLNE
jgi:hypothetical protein